MLAIVNSVSVFGMEAYDIKVEVDVSNGLPAFDIVGLPDASVREAKERVRTAIKNSGFEFPIKRITVNLAPANIKKEGALFDLPVAIGILAATCQIELSTINNKVFIGELSLDGSVRPVHGVLAMAILIKQAGLELYVPSANSYEAALAGNDFVFGIANLQEAVKAITNEKPISAFKADRESIFLSSKEDIDFADVKGQAWVKRALEIAAAGSHNLLLIGSPGSGKTMLARRLPTIMPDLDFQESLFLTKLYSIAGILTQEEALVSKRPFRAPHHTSSVENIIK